MSRLRLQLSAERRVEYLELGDRAGTPAVYLHGTPSSASEGRWVDQAARAGGVRIVSLDRPGYLGSDQHPGGAFTGVAEDVVAVAGALGLERFAVVGFSGGAGYALAVAHLAPQRVTVVHVGGGLASLAGDGARDLPWQRRLPFKLIAAAPNASVPAVAGVFLLLRRSIEKRLDSPVEAARWFFDGPAQGAQIAAVEEYVRASDAEELRDELHDFAQGTRATRAIVADVVAYARPWPFDLAGITTPVELWHGRNDPAVPASSAETLAAELPNGVAHIFDEEGHFVFHTHATEIVTSIRSRHEGL